MGTFSFCKCNVIVLLISIVNLVASFTVLQSPDTLYEGTLPKLRANNETTNREEKFFFWPSPFGNPAPAPAPAPVPAEYNDEVLRKLEDKAVDLSLMFYKGMKDLNKISGHIDLLQYKVSHLKEYLSHTSTTVYYTPTFKPPTYYTMGKPTIKPTYYTMGKPTTKPTYYTMGKPTTKPTYYSTEKPKTKAPSPLIIYMTYPWQPPHYAYPTRPPYYTYTTRPPYYTSPTPIRPPYYIYPTYPYYPTTPTTTMATTRTTAELTTTDIPPTTDVLMPLG